MQRSSVKPLIAAIAMVALASCGPGRKSGTESSSGGTQRETYWSLEVPSFVQDADAPVIELVGPKVILLQPGEAYVEHGATAFDAQDGDISAGVTVINQVNSEIAGDYFVRYQATDSSGKVALEKVRLIRVFDEQPATMAKRPHGSTQAHLGYIESLPANYGIDDAQQYALLIFNHGNGANAEISGSDPDLALNEIVSGAGPAWLQYSGKWDTTMPVVTLSPQMYGIGRGNEMARLNAFIDYAINTYSIEPSRIYVTGWSQGGFVSFLYAATYPHRVAAAVSISGGLPFSPGEAPANICDIETVPLWAFHAKDDEVVSFKSSVRTIDYVSQYCQPTVPPKLTLFQTGGHFLHHAIYDLRAMENGTLGLAADPTRQRYDISLFEWLLQHQAN